MSESAVCTVRGIAGQTAVYLLDDRIEVGSIDLLCQERLSRVLYRDVLRVSVWTGAQRWLFWFGVVLGAGALLILAGGVLTDDEGLRIATWFIAPIVAGLAALMLWRGRRHSVTHFRVDGIRGSVHGTLSGSRRKRERILADLEARIRARQAQPAA